MNIQRLLSSLDKKNIFWISHDEYETHHQIFLCGGLTPMWVIEDHPNTWYTNLLVSPIPEEYGLIQKLVVPKQCFNYAQYKGVNYQTNDMLHAL